MCFVKAGSAATYWTPPDNSVVPWTFSSVPQVSCVKVCAAASVFLTGTFEEVVLERNARYGDSHVGNPLAK